MDRITILFPGIGSINYTLINVSPGEIIISEQSEPYTELSLVPNKILSNKWWGISNYSKEHLVVLHGIFKSTEDCERLYNDYKEICDPIFDEKRRECKSIQDCQNQIKLIENCLSSKSRNF